jgi:hypothetical protein
MIEKISSQFVNLCIEECKKEDNKKVIKDTVLDPLIMHILSQLQPFVVASIIYFTTTLILMILLLVILLWPKNA